MKVHNTLVEGSKKIDCPPDEVALKSFFLGPQAENANWLRELLNEMFDAWFEWRRALYPTDGKAISATDKEMPEFIENRQRIKRNVHQLLRRFQNEVPSFSPRYIGHMLTEVSMPALIGHIITLLHNPNNISGESSRVGIVIEDEAINDLLKMIGYEENLGSGHFCSGGTIANIEAGLRARDRFARWLAVGTIAREHGNTSFDILKAGLMGWKTFDRLKLELDISETELHKYHLLHGNPAFIFREISTVFKEDYAGPVFLIPQNKHYSWNKCVDMLGLGEEAFKGVKTDEKGRLCLDDLRNKLEESIQHRRPPIMVVSVAGTTELGEVDPIDKVQALLDEYEQKYGIHIWHHVDAAYGGFMCSIDRSENSILSKDIVNALNAIQYANSTTIDPHKLGYVPYASGAFLCKHKREYFYRKSNAPYINFVGTAERGPQTIEGSRSAAGAVSTWLTARTIGLDGNGYGKILERTIKSRVKLEEILRDSNPHIRIFPHSTTNIITFCVAKENESIGLTNKRTLKVYDAFSPDENHDFFVSKTTLKRPEYNLLINKFTANWNAVHDTKELVLIRLVIMNPFFDTKENKIDYPLEFTNKLNEKITYYL